MELDKKEKNKTEKEQQTLEKYTLKEKIKDLTSDILLKLPTKKDTKK